MKHKHGEVVEPKERFVTYALQMDISDQVFDGRDLQALNRQFIAAAIRRARDAAADIDPDCPIIVTPGSIHTLPRPNPFTTRWGVHVRVEFPRYVYDDAKRLAEEWERTKHRYI